MSKLFFSRITNLEDLEKIKGSKYYQANISTIYSQIEKDLEVLKILKEHAAINKCIYDDTKMSNCIEIVILEGDKNYSKIKEWLENESR